MLTCRALLFLTLACVTACAERTAQSATSTKLPFALAMVRGEPAVLFNPDTGLTLAAREIMYDDFGGIGSYSLDLVTTQNDTIRAHIADADAGSAAHAKRFEAHVGSETLGAVPADSSAFSAAFIPKGPGGLNFKRADSVVTNLKNDDFGRQQVDTQEFTMEGIRWQAVFTGVTRDAAGRFTAVQVRFSRKM